MGKVLKIMLLALVVCSFVQMPAKAATIVSVDEVLISPEYPSTSDVITIISSGIAKIQGYTIETSFMQEYYLLELDVYFYYDEVTTPAIMPWSHSEEIGTLSPGDYDLIVNTFYVDYGDIPVHDDNYVGEFTVVPEPSTITMLSIGIFGLLRKKIK